MTVAGFSNRQANAAFGAQSLALVTADGVEWKLQTDRVDDDGFEVYQVVDDAVNLVRIRGLLGDAVRVCEQFGQVDVDVAADRIEAPRALAGSGSSHGTGDENDPS